MIAQVPHESKGRRGPTSHKTRRSQKAVSKSSTVESLYVRVNDAARLLCISRSAVYALMAQGEIAYARFGRSRRVPKAALEEFQKRCLVGTIGPE